jgi:hypothetical protein
MSRNCLYCHRYVLCGIAPVVVLAVVAAVGNVSRVNGNTNGGSKDELEEGGEEEEEEMEEEEMEEEEEGVVDGESRGGVSGQEMPLRHRIHVG